MDTLEQERIIRRLPMDARVVDVGGGAAPFPRADWVLDALPFDARGSLLGDNQRAARYSRDTWVQLDLCERTPWPVPDRHFDFAVCSHLLEDVRDPIWICSELSRIARAGYIEVPSRVVEQSVGVEHPSYAGYYHHRWLISARDGRLEFRHKPHLLHSYREAIVARLSPGESIHGDHSVLRFHWSGDLRAVEVLQFNEADVARELRDFAQGARSLPNLTVAAPRPLGERVRRSVYYSRLALGYR